MLSLIGKIIKIAGFSLLIIVLSNILYWDGRTISDQVRHSLAQAKRVDFGIVKNWSEGAKKTIQRGSLALPSSSITDIQPTERQKLRALIRELNTPSTP